MKKIERKIAKFGAQLFYLPTPREINTLTTSTCGLSYPGFILSSLSLICLWVSYHFFGLLYPSLSVVFCYISLLFSSVSRGRACICVVSSFLIVDCFGLCPVLISLIEGFSTLKTCVIYIVSLCVFLCGLLFDFFLIIIEHKRDTCYTLMCLYLNNFFLFLLSSSSFCFPFFLLTLFVFSFFCFFFPSSFSSCFSSYFLIF